MAEFQQLSQLDSGVLRANRIHSRLGAGVATRSIRRGEHALGLEAVRSARLGIHARE
jgi:hypothetical protein